MVVCASYNVVNVFDAESHESIEIIATKQVPVGITITPDGKRAFTANNGEPSVTVIDVKKLEPIESFPIGTFPFGIAYVEAAGRR
jgi:YVTN family beta-propeller protein